MKQRVRVVVVENERLHSELKSRVDESLKDYTLQNSMVIGVKITCMISVLVIYDVKYFCYVYIYLYYLYL